MYFVIDYFFILFYYFFYFFSLCLWLHTWNTNSWKQSEATSTEQAYLCTNKIVHTWGYVPYSDFSIRIKMQNVSIIKSTSRVYIKIYGVLLMSGGLYFSWEVKMADFCHCPIRRLNSGIYFRTNSTPRTWRAWRSRVTLKVRNSWARSVTRRFSNVLDACETRRNRRRSPPRCLAGRIRCARWERGVF